MGLSENYIRNHGLNYNPPKQTKKGLACNAIRDMFFHRHYNGVVPVKDMEIVKNGDLWHARFGKKNVQQAIKELEGEYMYLDEKKENWLWGISPEWHDMLFPKDDV